MPTIKNLLYNHDPDVQRAILTRWGFELPTEISVQDLKSLSSAAIQDGTILEIIQALPDPAKTCLTDLMKNDGKMPWSQFSRKYGEIRVMGAGRRERVHPEREPANSSEVLWYNGLMGKAFFNTKPEPVEYAYIPEEIRELLHQAARKNRPQTGKEFVLPKGILIQRAHDYILDDLCTVLAGLRMGMKIQEIQPMRSPFSSAVVQQLALSMGFYHPRNGLNLDAVQEHLTKPRMESYYDVLQNWQHSHIFPDVLLLSDLDFGKNPHINFLNIRQRMIDLLDLIPSGTWWELDATIADIKTNQPEFLRVAGDMDAWFIQDRQTGELLQGFEYWDEVEGKFIRFFIATILYGLGLCDLAIDRKSGVVLGFRWSERKKALHEIREAPDEEKGAFYALAQGNLVISPTCSRSLRYQIARFCEWKGMRRGEYQYQITPASLWRARQQDLQVNQLIGLLKKHFTKETVSGLFSALQHFEEEEKFATIQPAILLHIDDEKVLLKIKQSELKKYIIEEINSSTLSIDRKGIEQFQAKLTELGYLCHIAGEV